MKHFFAIVLLGLSLACSCEQSITEEQEEKHDKVIVNGGAFWRPNYFVRFQYLVSMLPLSSTSSPNTEVYFVLTDVKNRKQIIVPEEKYDSIRVALGDTIRYLASDAYAPGGGFVHDYSEIVLTSDGAYEGIPAGESLNSLVDYTYETVMPWIHKTQVNTNGRRDPEYSKVTCRLNELDLKDLNGCEMRSKLTFPSAPSPEQSFILLLKGDTRNASVSFTVPQPDDESTPFLRYYFSGGF